jgi:hypothetical protein
LVCIASVDIVNDEAQQQYLVDTSGTGIDKWHTLFLVNGPQHCEGDAGAQGWGNFCFNGGWIAYDHSAGHPAPYQEWYYSATKKLSKTVGGTVTRKDIAFIALGGYRELYAGHWIGRFVQTQPKVEAHYSAWFGQTAAAFPVYADGEEILLQTDPYSVNIRVKTTGGHANKRIEVAVPGKYAIHASMLARRSDWAYFVINAAAAVQIGLYYINAADAIFGGGPGDGNTFLSGTHIIAGVHDVQTDAVDSTRVIANLDVGQGIMLRNDSGINISLSKLSLAVHRIGPLDYNTYYP